MVRPIQISFEAAALSVLLPICAALAMCVYRSESSTQQTPFELPPLDGSKDSLRLLILLPGSWYRSIQCQLVSTTFSENPQYHALSYSSDNEEKSRYIWINDTEVQITQNLYDALSQLRHSTEPQALWVDELCIDQTNTTERNKQTALKAFTHRRAQSALVWLGTSQQTFNIQRSPADHVAGLEKARERSQRRAQDLVEQLTRERGNREFAMQELVRATKGKSRTESSRDEIISLVDQLADEDERQRRILQDISWERKARTENESFSEIIRPHLDRLAAAAYWKRAWTPQEIILAPEVRVVYGDTILPWDRFIDWISYYNEKSPNNANVKLILNLNLMRRSRYTNGTEYSLARLLDLFQDSSCSQAHDKIYAFLGLALDHIHDKFHIDYQKSLQEVYQDAIHFQNLESAGNQIQRSVEMVHFSALVRRLLTQTPSWQRQWDGEVVADIPQFHGKDEVISLASDDEQLLLSQFKKNPTADIMLRGLTIRVEHIGPPISALKASYNATMKWRSTIETHASQGARRTEALMRSEHLSSLLTHTQNPEDHPIRNLALTHPISNHDQLRLFIGAGGLVGLVPDSVQVGDLVYQSWNYHTCAVLRENTAYLRIGGGQRYELVAKAIMAGTGEDADWEVIKDTTLFTGSPNERNGIQPVLNLYTNVETLKFISS